MPSGKHHQAISKIRTGSSYARLHSWIDQGSEERGVNHRNKNHYYTEDLRKYISDNFGGPEAVSEWLFHIALDNLDTSVTNDWMHKVSDSNFHKFGFTYDGFIFYDEEKLSLDDLDDEFPEYE
jgi:hypothetical protein